MMHETEEVLTMSANTETTGADRAGCHPDCGKTHADHSLSVNDSMSPGWAIDSDRIWCSSAHRDARLPPIAAPAAHAERRKGQRWKSSRTMARGDTLIVTGTLMQRLDSEDGWTLSDVERSDGIGAFGSCFVDSLWSNPSDTMTLLADAPPEPAKACESCGGDESTCGVHGCPGGKIKTCPTCEWAMSDCACTPPVQEAQKAAPGRSRQLPSMSAPIENSAKKERSTSQSDAMCFDAGGTKCGGPVLTRHLPAYLGASSLRNLCDNHVLTRERSIEKSIGPSTGKPYAGPERLPRPQIAADWVEDCLGDVR